jgi:hypothetical protein
VAQGSTDRAGGLAGTLVINIADGKQSHDLAWTLVETF